LPWSAQARSIRSRVAQRSWALGPRRNQPRPRARKPAAGSIPVADLEAKLRLLKRLFEEDLITQEEYMAKKTQLLRSF
jgi:hypothetical protein